MALVYVHCPECQSSDVVQYGKQANGNSTKITLCP